MNSQFVEDHTVELDTLPFFWNVESAGPHYFLDVKMSRLKQLAFAFEFGSVDHRIVKLDISLNELEELPPGALLPFENLAELDASLNALGSVRGVEDLPNLIVLDLSYNVLRGTKELGKCLRLSVLRMSHNQLTTLKDIPLLSNLTQLHLSSNKLKSLEGVQHLPFLCELCVQKNCLTSLVPLASSLSLNILDASGNDIRGLPESLHVLRGLRRLKCLSLRDNPVARDNRYVTAIKESTSVEILDDMFLQHPSGLSGLPLHLWPLVRKSVHCSSNIAHTKADLEDVARRVLSVRLQQKKERIGSVIYYYHSRILELQEELRDYEEKLRLEADGCIRYIQMLSLEEIQNLDNPLEISEAMDKYLFTKFWEKWQKGRRKPASLPYKELTKPEDVIKAAASLLSNPPSCLSSTT